MALPSLGRLRLRATVRTGMDNSDVDSDPEMEDIGLAELAPAYPLGVAITLPTDLPALRALARTIEQQKRSEQFVFGCAGKDAPICGLRVDGATRLGEHGIFAAFATERLGEVFANMPYLHEAKEGCGTSNCFRAGVPLDGNDPWQRGARALLDALNQAVDEPQQRPNMPQTIATRAPKQLLKRLEGDAERSFALEAFDELMLTLYAAHVGLTPPVHLAFPVNLKSRFWTPEKPGTGRGYGYLMEDGWVSLADALEINVWDVHADNAEVDMAVLSIALGVRDLLRAVSDRYLLALDVNRRNLVVRRRGLSTDYEVRMIDFASKWTVDPNMHAPDDTVTTSTDCIFFVNGLCLLNEMAADMPIVPVQFDEFANEVLKLWDMRFQDVEYGGEGFCHALLEDKELPERVHVDMGNLAAVPRDQFMTALRAHFWRIFYTYAYTYEDGEPDSRFNYLEDLNKPKPGQSQRIMNRIVQHLRETFPKLRPASRA